MQATEKQKEDFHNIKRRMIEPAVKELIEKDGWRINWQPIKAGRRVKALRFEFSHSPPQLKNGLSARISNTVPPALNAYFPKKVKT